MNLSYVFFTLSHPGSANAHLMYDFSQVQIDRTRIFRVQKLSYRLWNLVKFQDFTIWNKTIHWYRLIGFTLEKWPTSPLGKNRCAYTQATETVYFYFIQRTKTVLCIINAKRVQELTVSWVFFRCKMGNAHASLHFAVSD